ncbi:MAG: hypothetical protein K1X55_15260 [Chitinophagales bacterium]|nr:hypothetical protein [Chitinophagales bacterium]
MSLLCVCFIFNTQAQQLKTFEFSVRNLDIRPEGDHRTWKITYSFFEGGTKFHEQILNCNSDGACENQEISVKHCVSNANLPNISVWVTLEGWRKGGQYAVKTKVYHFSNIEQFSTIEAYDDDGKVNPRYWLDIAYKYTDMGCNVLDIPPLTFCDYDLANGTASYTLPEGFLNTPLTLEKQNGSTWQTVSGSPFTNTVIFPSSGTYRISGDRYGVCPTLSNNFEVNSVTLPTISFIDNSIEICSGTTVTVSPEYSPSPSVPFTQFHWQKDGHDYSCSENLVTHQEGHYVLTAYSQGCKTTASVDVDVKSSNLRIVYDNGANDLCKGAVSIRVLGGVTNGSYIWSDMGTTTTGALRTGITAPGVYTVSGVSNGGCQTSASIDIDKRCNDDFNGNSLYVGQSLSQMENDLEDEDYDEDAPGDNLRFLIADPRAMEDAPQAVQYKSEDVVHYRLYMNLSYRNSALDVSLPPSNFSSTDNGWTAEIDYTVHIDSDNDGTIDPNNDASEQGTLSIRNDDNGHIFDNSIRVFSNQPSEQLSGALVTVTDIRLNHTIGDRAVLYEAIKFEAELSIEYVPAFSRADDMIDVSNLSATIDPTDRKATIHWPIVASAYEYELEIGYKDKYADNTTADRLLWTVTTSDNYYTFDLTYPEGTLYYKVRPIGRHNSAFETNYTHRYVGKWSDEESIAIDGTEALPFEPEYHWQKTITFAEDGKKKEVITYADDLMRPIQVVTNLNTEGLTLAGESYYDQEGRSVFNVLPVPLFGDNNLLYKSGLTLVDRGGSNVAPEAEDFDGVSTQPSISAGLTQQYYSSNNEFLLNPDKYYANMGLVPDAGGYISTLVRYMPDNSGRVSAQSGIGEMFRFDENPANSHYSRYYYGQPTQTELNRLFGSNVGEAQYYSKVMAVDPNGQVSVSIQNMAGKTIMTALAGDNPNNLHELQDGLNDNAPEIAETNVTEDLSTKNKIGIDGRSLVIDHEILNTTPNTDYTFTYDLDGAIAEFHSGVLPPGATAFCKECKYHLDIKIYNQRGELVDMTLTSTQPTPQMTVSISDYILSADLGDFGEACTTSPLDGTPSYKGYGAVEFEATFDEVGNYRVIKALTVIPPDNTILEGWYTANNLNVNEQNCQSVPTPDPSICATECEQIAYYLYRDEVNNDNDPNNNIEPNYANYANSPKNPTIEAYIQSHCDVEGGLVANAASEVQSECDAKYEMLLSQIGPDAEADLLAQYYNNETWLEGCRDLLFGPYIYDEDDLVFEGGDWGDVPEISPYNNFYEDWVYEHWEQVKYYFVKHHAEYCHYKFECWENRDSKIFDFKISHVNSQAVASSNNLWPFQDKDPYENEDLADMLNDYPVYKKNATTDVFEEISGAQTLWDITASNYEQGQELLPDFRVKTSDLPVGVSAEEYRYLRYVSLYLGLKAKFMEQDKEDCPYITEDYAVYPQIDFGTTSQGQQVDEVISNCQQAAAYQAEFTWAQMENLCPDLSSFSEAERNTFIAALTEEIESHCTGFDNIFGVMNSTEWQTFLNTYNTNNDPDIPCAVAALSTPLAITQTQLQINGTPLTVHYCTQPRFQELVNFANGHGFDISYPQPEEDLPLGGGPIELIELPTAIADITQLNITPSTIQTASTCCFNTIIFVDASGTKVTSIENLSSPLETPSPLPFVIGTGTGFYPVMAQSAVMSYMATKTNGQQVRVYPIIFSISANNAPCGDWLGSCNDQTVNLPNIIWIDEDGPFTDPGTICEEELTAEQVKLCELNSTTYQQQQQDALLHYYQAHCLNTQESFSYSYNKKEGHYTLYYYDIAGNLAQTIPPSGVTPLASISFNSQGKWNGTDEPDHVLNTRYAYNTRNQVVEQQTPDAGETNFWYNSKGQLMLSQNAKQAVVENTNESDYSFTKYDALGRISMVGELENINIATLATLVENANFVEDNNLMAAAHDITQTIYDLKVVETGVQQRYLRNRVSAVYRYEDNAAMIANSGNATIYSYDELGNVNVLVQKLVVNNEVYVKQVRYEYDLQSGKVNKVTFQKGAIDQYSHRYEYDADNRITDVYTSRDGRFESRDAKYFYYPHGPLARVELGDGKVQGVDYVYTLQGWLKGTNYIDPTASQDGVTGLDNFVAQDEMSFYLGYYQGDYNGIDQSFIEPFSISGITPFYNTSGNDVNGDKGLFNGNIAFMGTYLRHFRSSNTGPGIYTAYNFNEYEYDQLNRIRTCTGNRLGPGANDAFTVVPTVGMSYAYDPNGNITELTRSGINATIQSTALAMDDLEYHYTQDANGKLVNNRLNYVDDAINGTNSSNFDKDIEDQGTGNYGYDEIGNLIRDDAEDIDEIVWDVYGKIKSINFDTKSDLDFQYDAMGNRIAKIVKNGSTGLVEKTTLYFRDAQGNVLMTEEILATVTNNIKGSREFAIYGSSRLGVYTEDVLDVLPPTTPNEYERIIGLRSYELSNHLGNVLTTVSDYKSIISNGTDLTYEAVVLSASDYDPFGMQLAYRTYTATTSYSRGFNGQERDFEINADGNINTAMFWEYDARLGRRWNVDPVTYPWHGGYTCMTNNPIYFTDINGDVVDGDKKGLEDYNKAKQKANSKIQKLGEKINALSNKGKDKKIDNLKKQLQAWEQVKNEFNSLETSSVLYYINSGVTYSKTSITGNLGYNLDKERVEVNYKSGINYLAHELKHAYQYEILELDIVATYGQSSTQTGGGFAYDVYDEQEAYGRQKLFEGTNKFGTPTDAKFVYEMGVNYSNLQQKGSQLSVIFSKLILYQNSLYDIHNNKVYRYNGWEKDTYMGEIDRGYFIEERLLMLITG